jgi:CBS domain-containing protein
MGEQPAVISPDSNLVDAAQMMRDYDIGALPVCDGERVVGMITDRDITVRAVAFGKDVNSCKVREAMTKEVLWCFDDAELEEVENLMRSRQVRRVIVVNHDKRLTGIVSLGDIAKGEQDVADVHHTLHAISEPRHREPQGSQPVH